LAGDFRFRPFIRKRYCEIRMIFVADIRYNILVTLDRCYLKPLSVMLKSLMVNNPVVFVDVYVLHQSLTVEDINSVKTTVNENRMTLHSVLINDERLSSFPTSKRFPKEMYFRLFSANYLPINLERILYLDPDIIIKNSLKGLYCLNFDNNYFMACSHVFRGGQTLNGLRLRIDKETPYFNSGVILMNLVLMRQYILQDQIIDYITLNKKRLLLPDQDVFSALYGKNTKLLDSLIYNLSDRYKLLYEIRLGRKNDKISMDWVEKNTVIIHYCGRNKPWKSNYRGILNQYYHQYLELLKK